MFRVSLLLLIMACSISAPVAIAAVDINAGMSAEWAFEEGSGNVVRDTSDNNNNAVLINGPTWVKEGIGTAMQFDGIDDYLDAGSGARLDITEKVSLEAWVNPAEPSFGEPAILGKDMSAYTLTWSGTRMMFYINQGHINCTAELPLNEWSHVVGTYDGRRLRLYVNGKLVSGYIMQKPGTTIESRGDTVQLGRRSENGYYCGMIDNARIFSRPLSAKEVKSHYDEEVKLIKKKPVVSRNKLKGLDLKVYDAGTKPTTLVIKEIETVYADMTVPSNICLQFQMGGMIHVSEGVVLKLDCPLQPLLTQIFTGPGSVVFIKGSIDTAYPQWWGAKGNNTGDDTKAIQAAMDSFPTGGTVSFPSGTYQTSSTLKFYSNLTMLGPANIRCIKAMPAIIESYKPKARSSGLRIKGIKFDGRALNGDMSAIGINFTNVCSSSLEDVGVEYCETGIMMDGPIFCGYNSLMRMAIGVCTVGIEFKNSAIKTTIIGSNIGAVDIGILVTTTNQLDIFGLSIEGFRLVGIDVKRGDTVNMQHVYFANNDQDAIGIRIAEQVSDCTIVQPRYSHVATPIDNHSSKTLILATGYKNPVQIDKQKEARKN